MSPIDLGSMAQYLGPGTGGLWMGEQQRNAMQESELGQKKTLEEILTAQQNRDIAAQKAPLERAETQARTGLMGAQAGEYKAKEEERHRKIKKESYQEFIDGLTQMQDLGGLGEQAGYLNDLSKRTGIPQDHPMFEVALKMRAQGGPAWDNFVKSMKVSPETRYKAEQEMAREKVQQEAATGRTQMQTDAQRYAADQRLAAAKAKAAQGDQAMSRKSYAAAYNYYKAAADDAAAAGDTEKAQFLMGRAQEALAADAAARGAGKNVPQAGGIVLPPGSGLEQRPPQPLPTSAPPMGAGQQAPAQAARVTNDAEYNALPPGTLFTGPDGITRRKP